MAGKELTWDEQYSAQPESEWAGKTCVGCGAAIPDYRGLDRFGAPLAASQCLRCVLVRRPGELREVVGG